MSQPSTQWHATRRERVTTLLRLGPANLVRVGAYRAYSRLGVWRRRMPVGEGWAAPVLHEPATHIPAHDLDVTAREAVLLEAEEILAGHVRLFFGEPIVVGSPPAWHASPYDDTVEADRSKHWSAPYAALGDIKDIWELSRFTWAPTLAQAWRLTGDQRFLEALNRWVSDWTEKNPVNAGVNWACGQEASIRVLNFLLAAELMDGSGTPTAGSVRFVREHVERIAATTAYAVGQDNNHGTSEAAALFVGGAWLRSHGQASGTRYRDRGRRMLEERVSRLVMPDGSFSQYSVNYHRLLLDTLSITEWWRRRLDEASFSETVVERARAATAWLYEITDEISGDAPNVGANDGARLMGLSATPYRDFRPSVQLAAALFLGVRAYDAPSADEPLRWLEVPVARRRMEPRRSRVFEDGGWVTLHAPDAGSWACVRYPRFRFRPSHADLLHVDLWAGGRNVLRDGGSFGYAVAHPLAGYFPGTASHNTVQFDGRDQMPRVGRFLFGSWPLASSGSLEFDAESPHWTGEYRDARGAYHRRTVSAQDGCWMITDQIKGDFQQAVLRWRLAPGAYSLSGPECSGEGLSIRVICAGEPVFRLVEGWESRLYHEKCGLPVFEVSFGSGNQNVQTEIRVSENGQA